MGTHCNCRRTERVYYQFLTEIYNKNGIAKESFVTIGFIIDYDLEKHFIHKRSYENAKYFYEVMKNRLGSIYVKDFNRDIFEDFIEELTAKRTKEHDQYQPATINKYIAFMKHAFNFAKANGLVRTNPVENLKLREVNNVRDRILTNKEWVTLQKHLPDHLLPICRFAKQVPSRKTEIVNMRKEDVDLINRVCYLHDGETKSGKGRVLPIPPNMMKYFKSIPKSSEWVFYRKEYGKYYNLGEFKRSFRTACENAGVPWLHFHDLRHQAVTEMSRRRVPQPVIMKVAGLTTNAVFNRYRTVDLVDIKDCFKEKV